MAPSEPEPASSSCATDGGSDPTTRWTFAPLLATYGFMPYWGIHWLIDALSGKEQLVWYLRLPSAWIALCLVGLFYVWMRRRGVFRASPENESR